MVKDITLEPNSLGLKLSFVVPSSVTLGKVIFLCISFPICKITIPCWVVVRTKEIEHTQSSPGTYHILVLEPGYSLYVPMSLLPVHLTVRVKLVGSTMQGRLIENYLFAEANVEMNKDIECVSHVVK